MYIAGSSSHHDGMFVHGSAIGVLMNAAPNSGDGVGGERASGILIVFRWEFVIIMGCLG